MFRHERSYGGEFDTHRKIVRSLGNLPLNRELRTHYQYCNQMYVAATYALETMTWGRLGQDPEGRDLGPAGDEEYPFSP